MRESTNAVETVVRMKMMESERVEWMEVMVVVLVSLIWCVIIGSSAISSTKAQTRRDRNKKNGK